MYFYGIAAHRYYLIKCELRARLRYDIGMVPLLGTHPWGPMVATKMAILFCAPLLFSTGSILTLLWCWLKMWSHWLSHYCHLYCFYSHSMDLPLAPSSRILRLHPKFIFWAKSGLGWNGTVKHATIAFFCPNMLSTVDNRLSTLYGNIVILHSSIMCYIPDVHLFLKDFRFHNRLCQIKEDRKIDTPIQPHQRHTTLATIISPSLVLWLWQIQPKKLWPDHSGNVN